MELENVPYFGFGSVLVIERYNQCIYTRGLGGVFGALQGGMSK